MKTLEEASYTYSLTQYLLEKYPQKRFVFDAGALQMMEKEWLKKNEKKSLIHSIKRNFSKLFGIDISKESITDKGRIVKEQAKNITALFFSRPSWILFQTARSPYLLKVENQGLPKAVQAMFSQDWLSRFSPKTIRWIRGACFFFLKKNSGRAL